MARTPTPVAQRVAVIATGLELLALIAATEGGALALTQEEGAQIVADGDAIVGDGLADGTAMVSLTDAGKAKLDAASTGDKPDDNDNSAPATGATGTTAASKSFEIDADIPMPTKTKGARGGRTGGYPWDKLEIGQSFHVPATAAVPNPRKKLLSSVSSARMSFATDHPTETEVVKKTIYQVGADGKALKDAEGKKIKVGETNVTQPKKVIVRDFEAFEVGATDPRGPGARVFRTK